MARGTKKKKHQPVRLPVDPQKERGHGLGVFVAVKS